MDQSEKFVKLYVSECMKGVHTLSADSIVTDFQTRQYRVLVKGLNGMNYEMVVTNLLSEIDPAGSYVKQRENEILIMLRKKYSDGSKTEWWEFLTVAEKRVKDSKERRDKEMYKPSASASGSGSADKEEDPSAGMMNMMRRMYEEGDDNMKRTIAEAWTKAQDKKGFE